MQKIIITEGKDKSEPVLEKVISEVYIWKKKNLVPLSMRWWDYGSALHGKKLIDPEEIYIYIYN